MESVEVDAQPPSSGTIRTVGEVGDQAQHVDGGPVQRDLVTMGQSDSVMVGGLGLRQRGERVLTVG